MYCGGGGYSTCGRGAGGDASPDASVCIPATCAQLGYDCGPAGDGCGNQIQCGSGTCPMGQYCGGGGFNKCGTGIDGGTTSDGGPSCVTPATCQSLGYNCGPQGDGCGNLLQCGTCTAPAICGGGGTPGVCGTRCVGLKAAGGV
jgi:hypothetical protein